MKMKLKENGLFYTPKTQDELWDRIDALSRASGDGGAIWTAAMLMHNFIAYQMKEEDVDVTTNTIDVLDPDLVI